MVFSPHTQTPSAHSVPLFPPLLPPGPLPAFPSPPPCSLTATLSVSASAQTPCLSASVPLAFPQSQRFAASCLPLYISPNLPISLSCLGMDVSVDSLPASLLCISVNISFSHCPVPISTPSRLLCHVSLLSSPLVHLVVPFIMSGRN